MLSFVNKKLFWPSISQKFFIVNVHTYISFFKILNHSLVFAHFSVMERDGKPSGNANVVDQQTQTPGDGVSITFRSQLKNATRNIKNRWSSSGADASTGIMTGTYYFDEIFL